MSVSRLRAVLAARSAARRTPTAKARMRSAGVRRPGASRIQARIATSTPSRTGAAARVMRCATSMASVCIGAISETHSTITIAVPITPPSRNAVRLEVSTVTRARIRKPMPSITYPANASHAIQSGGTLSVARATEATVAALTASEMPAARHSQGFVPMRDVRRALRRRASTAPIPIRARSAAPVRPAGERARDEQRRARAGVRGREDPVRRTRRQGRGGGRRHQGLHRPNLRAPSSGNFPISYKRCSYPRVGPGRYRHRRAIGRSTGRRQCPGRRGPADRIGHAPHRRG